MSRSREEIVVDASDRRRLSARQVRHAARVQMMAMRRDEEALEESVLPIACHDLGRHASPRFQAPRHPEQRSGFKVWKTQFWKRRSQLRAERNARERQLALGN